MSTIRTRFAPSPTGYLHVGGIRTALFAYLVAKQTGGQFVLRLEDTDKKREVEGSAEHLIASLTSLNLQYDEGPDIGGPYGPYKQSDRLENYKKWAQQLVDAGRAYADPYTPEEIQAFRDEALSARKAFLYRDHRPDNPPAWDGSQPLRFKSDPKHYDWHDEVMGDMHARPDAIDDFIMIKSDGYPTYNFAHIIDDLEMKITHVIRGQEFISSMPNYLNLYEALNFDMPDKRVARRGAAPTEARASRVEDGANSVTGPASSDLRVRQLADDDGSGQNDTRLALPLFAHLPHILNEQGNKKLGKRDGAKDVLDYIRDGYLPEALDSFIATMGWNDGTEQEVFTMDELIAKFSLDRVQRSGARFDEKRLLWMNGHFIRELSLDDLYKRVTARGAAPAFEESEGFSKEGADALAGPASSDLRGNSADGIPDDGSGKSHSFWPESSKHHPEDYQRRVLALAQDRLKTLKDLPELTSYFFEEPSENWSLITENRQLGKLERSEITRILQAAHDALANVDDWTPDNIQTVLNNLLESLQLKPAILFGLVRIATTWAQFSPQLNDTLALLGKQKTLDRLAKCNIR